MNASYDKNAAIVVLPPVSGGRLGNKSLRTWLARSDLTRASGPIQSLPRVVRELGQVCPDQGIAALRLWGQMGERPANWIAAADPVYLEPRLDHLVLHSLGHDGVDQAEMRVLIDHLQATLGSDQYEFMCTGNHSYLSATSPIATAGMSADLVNNRKPDDFLPSGDDSAEYRNLSSEIEMALHEHDVNLNREALGRLPINSLWLWGGGLAPAQETDVQPPLFADDALMRGYWKSVSGVDTSWPGNIRTCIEESTAGFVAEVPEISSEPALLESCLDVLRDALDAGRLSSVTLLFRDGLRAHVKRSHSIRLWRRRHRLLDDAVK